RNLAKRGIRDRPPLQTVPALASCGRSAGRRYTRYFCILSLLTTNLCMTDKLHTGNEVFPRRDFRRTRQRHRPPNWSSPMFANRRLVLAALSAAALAAIAPIPAHAQSKLAELRIDWATYNPVSIILKNQGLLEKEFEKDGTKVRWVQTLGSNKALEFLNAGSIDLGSTAGSAALVAKINGNPIKSIYVYSRPEWTALVTRKDTNIKTVADLKGKSVAVTRGTDP